MAYANKQITHKKQNKYIAEHYDRINLTIPKGKKETLQAYAKSQGKSVNKLIWDLLANELDKGES